MENSTGAEFVRTSDGFNLAYQVHGSGPALLLLHGFSNDGTMWATHGWVARLQREFTVITMDLRGCGQSTGSTDPADYTIERHLADVHAVMDACGVDPFRIWGWSLGATVGLHLAAHSPRLVRAVVAGTYFGRLFTEAWLQPRVQPLERLVRAQAEGRLDQLDLSPQDQRYLARPDLPVYLARLKALEFWPVVEPQDLQCPTLVCTGTADGNVVVQLEKQRGSIVAAGQQLSIFERLDHLQLVSEADVIQPVVLAFLRSG